MVRRPALHDRVVKGILDTAAIVLTERGETVSMAEIAEAAGVGRATLYRYFPNREALLQGLARAAFDELGARITEAELDAVPVREGVARLTRGFVTAGSKYAAIVQTGKKHLGEIEVEELDEKITQPVRALLARGVADGTLRDDVPIDIQFEMFRGLLEKALQLVMRGQVGIEPASAAVVALFLDGTTKGAASPV